MKMLKEILERFISDEVRRQIEEEEYYPGVYWPSEVWRCMRASYLRRMVKHSPTVETVKYGVLGLMVHRWVAEVFAEAAEQDGSASFSVESEVNVRIPVEYVDNSGREQIVLSGRMDDVFVIWGSRDEGASHGGAGAGRRTIIAEVKTVSTFPRRVPVSLPFKEHCAQLNCYLKAYPYAQGVMLYISRRDLEMREYPMRYDETLWVETEVRLRRLHEYIKRGVIPPPEAKIDPRRHYECTHCAYREICYERGEAAVSGESVVGSDDGAQEEAVNS